MTRTEVVIPCGSLSLEGVLEVPERLAGQAPAAVICHPHPLYGGNMHNNVVRALQRALNDRGFTTLRFNFRGVGRSWGQYGEGVDEQDDVIAAMDFVLGLPEVDAGRLLLAGYSFGCWVCLKAASRDARPGLLVGISPPVDMYDFGFLKDEKRPKLLVAGDRDFVCSVAKYEELLSVAPEPKQSAILAGVDHFHAGTEDLLTRELHAFVERHL